LIALFLVFISQISQAQNSSRDYLVRATTGTSGSSDNLTANNKQYVVQQSIGQASVIGTFYDNNYTLRQGFIQPNVLAKIIDEAVPLSLEAIVYPNPFVKVSILFQNNHCKVEGCFDPLATGIFKSYMATQELNVQFNELPVTGYILKVIANNKQFIKNILKK
jgi:hypothetical protein